MVRTFVQTESMNVVIVIPVLNGGDLLLTTLDSVAAQTYRQLSVAIYDNASTDGTADRVQRFIDARQLANWRVERASSTCGMTENWNRAIAHCGGDAVKVLPADDLLSPECIERQVAILEQHPGVGFVAAQKNIIGTTGQRRPYGARLPEGPFYRRTLHDRMMRSPMNFLGEPGAMLIRRTSIDQVGGFDPSFSYYPDLDYWVRLLAVADGYYLHGADYFYRVHGGSITGSKRLRTADEFAALVQKHGRYDGTPISGWHKVWRWWYAQAVSQARNVYLQCLK
jgi:glycosyltransferase involved in cell wall biosynthesis